MRIKNEFITGYDQVSEPPFELKKLVRKKGSRSVSSSSEAVRKTARVGPGASRSFKVEISPKEHHVRPEVVPQRFRRLFDLQRLARDIRSLCSVFAAYTDVHEAFLHISIINRRPKKNIINICEELHELEVQTNPLKELGLRYEHQHREVRTLMLRL